MCKGESLTERSKPMKHKVVINVTDDKGDKMKSFTWSTDVATKKANQMVVWRVHTSISIRAR